MTIRCNVGKLHSELISVGIRPYPVFDNDDGTGTFNFPTNTDLGLAQQVIDAHISVPLPIAPSQEERLTTVETVQDEIIDTLAIAMGVTL